MPQTQYKTVLSQKASGSEGRAKSESDRYAAYRAFLPELLAPLQRRYFETAEAERGTRRVHYLSMEFLLGRALGNSITALGCDAEWASYLAALGVDGDAVFAQEADAALGNGGLGRLAACFLDAMAELRLPSFGYGLRYDYGMFKQSIDGGQQREAADDWLAGGTPWEIARPDIVYPVHFGGVGAEGVAVDLGQPWLPTTTVLAVASDWPIPAQSSEHVAVLRLWRAKPVQPVDYQRFSAGQFDAACQDRLSCDHLNSFLYPDDSTPAGRELRLRQEYLLVSATVQDIIARHLQEHGDIHRLADKAAIHLNDTHPALAAPELLRLLIDEHGLGWDEAMHQLVRIVSYTNHTLMPEALETWPLALFERLLPRHLALIYEWNGRFLDELRRRFPGDEALVQRVSLIDEGPERRIRMGYVAVLAAHAVNGVSALHSRLMVETIFADWARLFPERFCNVTNGITPRRWLMSCNPSLSGVLDRRLGESWRRDLNAIARLAARPSQRLVNELAQAKRANKERLAELIKQQLGWTPPLDSLFDVHCKRIHEYKRQLLNLLHVVARYQSIVAHPEEAWQPRVVIFAGKAASAYVTAKLIIRLIHDVAQLVNNDPRVGDRLKVVFLPNYGVSMAEILIPGADLSEQISTAGTEASGTGNMKFALNGALTIGTWDGATIEMAEHIGKERLFVFGLTADEVLARKAAGYQPIIEVERDPRLAAVLEAIADGYFSAAEPDRYRALVDSLRQHDPYLLLADFSDYLRAQRAVDDLYADPSAWFATTAHNIAAMAYFSADRAIGEYASRIWSLPAPESP